MYLKKLERDINTTHTGKPVIRWYGNKLCDHWSLHQILIFPNILIPPFNFHIRTRLFHHAWLMIAILVHFTLQWRSSHAKKRPKPACDIQFLIRKKFRLWAHLEQLSMSLACDNRDFLTVQKILNNMYISGFVNTICGTNFCEMPKNKGTIMFISNTCNCGQDGNSLSFTMVSKLFKIVIHVVHVCVTYMRFSLFTVCASSLWIILENAGQTFIRHHCSVQLK